MTQVDFYHLSAAPVERVLPAIAEKVIATGGRLVIIADTMFLTKLDSLLWTYRPESFLPHARAGSARDPDQPVLLAEDANTANGARNIALADGVWRNDALDFERTFFLFGEERIVEARQSWKALADRKGIERRYWKQTGSGGWEQLA